MRCPPPPPLHEAEPEVPILPAAGHRRVVPPNQLPVPLPEQGGAGPHHVSHQHLLDRKGRLLGLELHRTEEAHQAGHDGHLFAAIQDGDRLFQVFPGDQVIRVEREDIGPAGGANRRVAGSRHPLVHGLYHPRFGAPVLPEQLVGERIGRAVVHDQDLQVVETLCQNGVDRLVQKFSLVVAGYDDAYLGHLVSWAKGSAVISSGLPR